MIKRMFSTKFFTWPVLAISFWETLFDSTTSAILLNQKSVFCFKQELNLWESLASCSNIKEEIFWKLYLLRANKSQAQRYKEGFH